MDIDKVCQEQVLEHARLCREARQNSQDLPLYEGISLAKNTGLISTERVDLSGADLSGIDFKDQDLTRLHLEGANLQGATFSSCHFSGVTFSSVNLQGVHFSKCNLSLARFTKCDFSGAHFVDCTLESSVFESSPLKGVVALRCNFNEANLPPMADSEFRASRFESAFYDEVQNCSLEYSWLRRAKIYKPITNTAFGYAAFHDVDLRADIWPLRGAENILSVGPIEFYQNSHLRGFGKRMIYVVSSESEFGPVIVVEGRPCTLRGLRKHPEDFYSERFFEAVVPLVKTLDYKKRVSPEDYVLPQKDHFREISLNLVAVFLLVFVVFTLTLANS